MADRRRVAGEDTETESEEEEGTVTEDQEQEQEGQLSTNHQKPSEGCDVKDGKKQGRRANNATIEDKPISSPDSANVIDTVSRTSSDAVLSTSGSSISAAPLRETYLRKNTAGLQNHVVTLSNLMCSAVHGTISSTTTKLTKSQNATQDAMTSLKALGAQLTDLTKQLDGFLFERYLPERCSIINDTEPIISAEPTTPPS
eukprot:gene7949-7744_t